MGDAGCFSFYPTKNLGAIGDGGMVVTNNAELAQRVQRLAQYGWDETRSTVEPGINSRLDEMQAAILSVKLKKLDADNANRASIAMQYDQMLSESQVIAPAVRPDVRHVFHLYVVSCKNRDALKKQLAVCDILAGIHYPVPAHRHPGYDGKCILPKTGLPVTDKIVGNILSLPMYPEILQNQMELLEQCFGRCV